MENLVFALNATMPVFLVMVVGYLLQCLHIFDEAFASKINKYVFSVAMPVMLIRQIGTVDFRAIWDTSFVLFCFAATLISIGIAWLLSRCLKDQSEKGEFIQAAYRSSAALLGMAYMTSIYGNADALPLMILATFPCTMSPLWPSLN